MATGKPQPIRNPEAYKAHLATLEALAAAFRLCGDYEALDDAERRQAAKRLAKLEHIAYRAFLNVSELFDSARGGNVYLRGNEFLTIKPSDGEDAARSFHKLALKFCQRVHTTAWQGFSLEPVSVIDQGDMLENLREEWATVEARSPEPADSDNPLAKCQAPTMPSETTGKDGSDYSSLDNYERDLWIYRQKEAGRTNGQIMKDLEAYAQPKGWYQLESRSGILEAVNRIADYHGWPKVKGKSGRPRTKPR